MDTASNLTVMSAKSRKRVLLTTPTWEGVIPFFQNRRRHKPKISEMTSKRELLELCMNAELQMDFEWPFGAIHILQANIPSVDILDYPSMEEYEERLRSGKYDVVAMSFYRFNVPRVLEMARMARNYGVRELWAGNYGANTPGLEGIFDRIIDSDGVAQMKELVEGEQLELRRHPVLKGTMLRGVPIGYLYTGVGCRYQCKFCPTTTFMPDPFYTPIEEIRRILDIYVASGINTVSILDETFLQDRGHSDLVIQELSKRQLMWHCTSRVTLLAGRIKELHRAGLRSVYTGVETLANHTLTTYVKGQTVQSILKLFKELNDVGVTTTITYIFGFEFDTAESILEAVDIIKNDIRPFCVSILVLTPHTNSQMAHIEPLVFDRDDMHYDSQHLVWQHPTLSADDLYQLLTIAHRETVHPRNLVKKRIVERMKALEAGDTALFSDRMRSVHAERVS